MFTQLRLYALAGLLFGCSLLLIVHRGISEGATSVATGITPVSTSQVLKMVASSVSIRTLPKHPIPSLQVAVGDNGSMYVHAQAGCVVSYQGVTAPDCVWGDRSGSRTMVWLGDSHAWQWASAFDTIGKRLHWKVVLLGKASCPAPYTEFYDWATHSSYHACDVWHDYVIARIKKTNPDLLVVSGEDFSPLNGQRRIISRSVWESALVKTLHMINSSKTRKVILGPTPHLSYRMWSVNCLAAHEDNVQLCSSSRSAVIRLLYNDADQDAAKKTSSYYIDVLPWFCTSICPAVIGNMVVYGAHDHITNQYAAYLTNALQDALQPIMARSK
jgi:hypothetical protein